MQHIRTYHHNTIQKYKCQIYKSYPITSAHQYYKTKKMDYGIVGNIKIHKN